MDFYEILDISFSERLVGSKILWTVVEIPEDDQKILILDFQYLVFEEQGGGVAAFDIVKV